MMATSFEEEDELSRAFSSLSSLFSSAVESATSASFDSTVEYELFVDPAPADSDPESPCGHETRTTAPASQQNHQYYLHVLRDVDRHVKSMVEAYFWHKESFRLRWQQNGPGATAPPGSVTCRAPPAVSCSAVSPSFQEPFLWGRQSVGDAEEDAWFVVFLLLRLTAAVPALSARVRDEDGEFMLIEAAHHIPRWLNPDTSDNVVFIRRGKVCIVDPASKAVSHTHSHDEKTARSRKRCVNAETKRRPVELEEALQNLRDPCVMTEADAAVQRCIASRVSQFSRKADGQRHNLRVYLPPLAAQVLSSEPALAASAIHALCQASPSQRRKVVRSISTFAPGMASASPVHAADSAPELSSVPAPQLQRPRTAVPSSTTFSAVKDLSGAADSKSPSCHSSSSCPTAAAGVSSPSSSPKVTTAAADSSVQPYEREQFCGLREQASATGPGKSGSHTVPGGIVDVTVTVTRALLAKLNFFSMKTPRCFQDAQQAQQIAHQPPQSQPSPPPLSQNDKQQQHQHQQQEVSESPKPGKESSRLGEQSPWSTKTPSDRNHTTHKKPHSREEEEERRRLAWDRGMKLACGLELLLTNTDKDLVQPSQQTPEALADVLTGGIFAQATAPGVLIRRLLDNVDELPRLGVVLRSHPPEAEDSEGFLKVSAEEMENLWATKMDFNGNEQDFELEEELLGSDDDEEDEAGPNVAKGPCEGEVTSTGQTNWTDKVELFYSIDKDHQDVSSILEKENVVPTAPGSKHVGAATPVTQGKKEATEDEERSLKDLHRMAAGLSDFLEQSSDYLGVDTARSSCTASALREGKTRKARAASKNKESVCGEKDSALKPISIDPQFLTFLLGKAAGKELSREDEREVPAHDGGSASILRSSQLAGASAPPPAEGATEASRNSATGGQGLDWVPTAQQGLVEVILPDAGSQQSHGDCLPSRTALDWDSDDEVEAHTASEDDAAAEPWRQPHGAYARGPRQEPMRELCRGFARGSGGEHGKDALGEPQRGLLGNSPQAQAREGFAQGQREPQKELLGKSAGEPQREPSPSSGGVHGRLLRAESSRQAALRFLGEAAARYSDGGGDRRKSAGRYLEGSGGVSIAYHSSSPVNSKYPYEEEHAETESEPDSDDDWEVALLNDEYAAGPSATDTSSTRRLTSETEASGSDEEGELSWRELGALMDAELDQSKMGASFVRASNVAEDTSAQEPGALGDAKVLAPVDVDMNLVTQLLQSMEAQGGAPGPASSLIRELGLRVPQPEISGRNRD